MAASQPRLFIADDLSGIPRLVVAGGRRVSGKKGLAS